MRCVIFGAGKIARGFIGHLLYLSNIPFTFVEKADVSHYPTVGETCGLPQANTVRPYYHVSTKT